MKLKESKAIETLGGIPSTKIQLLKSKLEEIEKTKGLIQPIDLINEARPEGSPFHDMFEWDNEVAGDKFRLWQSRFYIGQIRVEIEEKRMPAFMNVMVETGDVRTRGYKSFNAIVSQPTLLEQIINTAIKEISYFQEKYKDIKELSEVIDTTKVKKIKEKYIKE